MLQNRKTRESSRFVNLMADLCLYLDYGREIIEFLYLLSGGLRDQDTKLYI